MKRKTEFLLLTRHTDAEITDFLQRQAESGWWLVDNRGNHFIFEQRSYRGQRICSYSFFSRGPESSTEMQLRQELPILRRQGWDMICISGPENIVDSRRHAFLYEEYPRPDDPVALPVSEDEEFIKARRRSIRKAFSNLLLSLIYLACIVFVFSNDLLSIVTDTSYMVLALIISILLLLCMAASAISAFSVVNSRKKPDEEIKSKRYRALDISTRMTFIMLLLLAFFLLFDSVWNNPSSKGIKTTINGQRVILYSDSIPISLDDIGADTSGAYRTSTYKSSESFMGSYYRGFDESLGSNTSEVSFISYLYFETISDWLLDVVSRQVFPYASVNVSELASVSCVDGVFYDKTHSQVLLTKGNSIMLIKSGFVLSDQQLKTFGNLLRKTSVE